MTDIDCLVEQLVDIEKNKWLSREDYINWQIMNMDHQEFEDLKKSIS